MQLKNLSLLHGLIFANSHIIRGGNTDMICIGVGQNNNNHSSQFGIPYDDLYQHFNGAFQRGYYGSSSEENYYITREFYNSYVKVVEPTMPTMSSSVAKGESFIGKYVEGDTGVFKIEFVNLYNRNSHIPDWFPDWAQDIIDDRGWVVLVENDNEFADADEVVEITNSIILNGEYTAIVVGDVVKVGCQEIPTATVLKLAELIKHLS
jgi:hypothetical protein